MKSGRNDPCWCGSGKKYKKCHLKTDQAVKSRPVSPPERCKSQEQIEGMRKAGRFNGELMDYVRPHVVAGRTTDQIDRLVHEFTLDHGHTPATLGYKGFPKSCCTSINHVVCHGIPSERDELKDGDIVNVDLTTIVDGFYGDQSETFIVGEVPEVVRDLVRDTALATLVGLDSIKPGRTLRDLGGAIQDFAEQRGYSVVREYTGHGIGTSFHEDYSVFHYRAAGAERIVLEPGMTFTVEPMVNIGGWQTRLDPDDGWTVYTADGELSAQFEHTIVVTETGCEILTLTPQQREAGQRLIVDGIDLGPIAKLAA